jgi:hypothetical protein
VLNFVSYKKLTTNCNLWKYNGWSNALGMVAKCKTTQRNDIMECIKGWFKSNLLKKMHAYVYRKEETKNKKLKI